MPNRKLSKEEIEVILNAFDWDQFKVRSIWRQSCLFQAAFFFLNIYIGLYVIFGSFFPDLIFSKFASDLMKDDYLVILSARSLVGMVLLFVFNMAFMFSSFFRFVALVSFAYLFNASIDVYSIFLPFFDLSKFNLATILFWLRPVSILSILVCILTFEPDV